MGLDITIGALAGSIGVDDEGEDMIRHDLSQINAVLRDNGLPEHKEPEELPPFEWRPTLVGLGYSWIHYLRRIQAHLDEDPTWKPTPVDQDGLDEDTTADDVIGSCNMNLHLLWHSDCEGYYLPQDFRHVLMDVDEDRIPGAMLGSSVRLMKELVELAPHIGIELHDGKLESKMLAELNEEPQDHSPFGIERVVWLHLYEAARLSLELGTAIRFS